jgi:acetyltransferase
MGISYQKTGGPPTETLFASQACSIIVWSYTGEGDRNIGNDTIVLESLFYPGTIAVVGASRRPGNVGHEVLANLVGGGFGGRVVPVNPSAEEILGIRCYRSLAECGEKIDLGIIALRPGAVEAAVEESIKARAKFIAVLSSGFRETGDAGERIERRVLELCAGAGVRLLGPNCLGLINTDNSMNASFSRRMPQPGGISIISQSGAICTAILDWASAHGLGVAKMVSIGNKADLDETDFLPALGRDSQTKLVIGYLENITSGEKFIKAAESVTSTKPVIIFRAGTTASGIRAASSHTGNIAGDDIAYGAAFKRAGVIRADNFESLYDFAAAISLQPLPLGPSVAIVTNAGGPGVVAADVVEQSGMNVATLDDRTSDRLRRELPSAARVSNPVDVLGDADPLRYAKAVEAAQQDGRVDSVIVILTPHAMIKPLETVRAICAGRKAAKPVMLVLLGSADVRAEHGELSASGLPHYPSPERAVAALRAMYEYRLWQNRPPRVVVRFPVNRRRVDRIISRYFKTGRLFMGEVEAKEVLRAYDFTVPEGRLATDAEQAAEIAERIGFPVVMKITSPDIVHKSDVGGIKLGVSSGEEVRDTFDLLTLRLARRAPQARLEGIYVEKMCAGGLAVILGMTHDPKFGPMLMFGLGGIFVEVLKDMACYLAPLTSEEAMRMLRETRSYELLQSARGQANVDLAAIARGLQRVSQLATDFPQISELNINPFIVTGPGVEPVVVDARITLSATGKRTSK